MVGSKQRSGELLFMIFSRSHPSAWVQMICTWTKDLLIFLSSGQSDDLLLFASNRTLK